MKKKEIQIFNSFEEMNRAELRRNLDMSLQERWDAFWKLKEFHKKLFGKPEEVISEEPRKKRIIISKPDWL